MKNLTTPLNSTDAEQSVLGGLILDNSALERVEILQATDFYHKSHECIFEKIITMLNHNQPVDVITLAESLKKSGEIELAGGIGYLHALVQNTPSAANIQRYAALVHDYKVRRNVIELGQKMAVMAQENTENLLENVTHLVMSAADNRSTGNNGISIGQLLPALLDTLDARLEQDGVCSGVSTGFTDLDQKTCGLQPGDLIVIAGRPSMGKTTLAVNVAENVAAAGGVALVISLEMAATQLAERSIARFGGIDTQVLRTGKLSDEDYTRLTFGLQKLQDQNLIIADDPALSSVAKVRLCARKTKQKLGQKLDLIVIDYLQLMQGTGNTRNEEISGITRSLKLLAKELDCPIILLSQLSRDVEKRTDKRPLLSDLRDSGSIEQDADVVLMAYRDDYYNPESPLKGYAELLIRKQRMGPLADIQLCFEGRYSRFLDADQRELARLRNTESTQASRKHGF